MSHGEYNHIEIPYDDETRAKAFYSTVFGWSFQPMEGYEGYSLYEAGPGGLGGGFGKRGVNAPDAIRNYISVDDLDDSLAAVEPNGGTITTGKTDLGFGWYAVIQDSEGNEIGLYQRKPEA